VAKRLFFGEENFIFPVQYRGQYSKQNVKRNQSIVPGYTILACHASAVTIGKVASNVATLLSWRRRHLGGIVAGTFYKRKLKEWGEISCTSALTVQAARKVGNKGSLRRKHANPRKRSGRAAKMAP
jgi:hypothetical protein